MYSASSIYYIDPLVGTDWDTIGEHRITSWDEYSSYANLNVAEEQEDANRNVLDDLSELSNEEAINTAAAVPIFSTTANSSSSTSRSNSPDSAAALLTEGLLIGDAAVSSDKSKDMKAKSPCFTEVPYQDETGFDWLSCFNEDQSLIYGEPSFGMDTFLFDGNEQLFAGVPSGNEQQLKENEEDNQKKNGGNDDVESAAMLVIPPAAGKASRSKRVRSNGWPSTSIICSWDKVSPTPSLDSTTSDVFPTMETFEYQSLIETPNTIKLANHLHGSKKSRASSSSSSWLDLDDEEDDERMMYHGSGGNNNSPPPPIRRCTHCLSTKTPQWRAGPAGPKTLCNACGVRYKSGRLFDEYRPAKSPTFVSHKHSNSHKKVMEMRRRKLGYLHAPDTSTKHQHLSSNSNSDSHDHHHHMIKFKVKFNSSIQMPSQCSDAALINTTSRDSIPALESPTFLY